MSKVDRKFLDETFANMFSNPTYSNYLFYAHILGQCSVKIDETLPAPAAVAFVQDHFELYINPELGEFPINQRIGILKHEALHIINGHLGNRFKGCNFRVMNYATDTAINQQIERNDLPEGVLYPDTLSLMLTSWNNRDILPEKHLSYDELKDFFKKNNIKLIPVPKDLTSEEYYNLIIENMPEDMKQDSQCNHQQGENGEGEGQPCPDCNGSGQESDNQDGSGSEDGQDCQDEQDGQDSNGSGEQDSKECKSCGGSGKQKPEFKPTEHERDENGNLKSVDDHSKFGQDALSEDFLKERTKSLMEKAKEATLMSNGSLPSNYSDMLELNSPTKSELPWQKLFQNVSSNTKKHTRETYMRRSRRFRNRPEVKGKLSNRTFEWLTIVDVSGSMPDKAVRKCLQEMVYLCKKMDTSARLIQVDVSPQPSQEITSNLKKFERKACGGTDMFPGIQQAQEEGLQYDAVVILTDGGLCDSDIDRFLNIKKPVIWIVTDDYNIELARFQKGNMKAARLKT